MPVYRITRMDPNYPGGSRKENYMHADKFEMKGNHFIFYKENIALAAILSDKINIVDLEALDSKTTLNVLAHGLRSRKRNNEA